MDPLYGVFAMMVLIVAITVALVRAPRRTHAWEKPRASPRAPEEAGPTEPHDSASADRSDEAQG